MIDRVNIRGFRCHKRLALELDAGVNCLTGDTDAGKSTALTAIRWCLTNRPEGESVIAHGEELAAVAIRFIDGTIMERRRGKRVNTYSLEGEEYKAFGAGAVPAEIEKHAAVADVNFHGQHDSIFWLADSPGKVSRELNAVVNLEVIDSSLQAISAEARRTQASLEECTERHAAAEVTLGRLNWVPTFVERYEAWKELRIEHTARRKAQYALGVIIQEVESLTDGRRELIEAASTTLEQVMARRRRCLELSYLIANAGVEADTNDYEGLQQLIGRVVPLRKRLDALQKLVYEIEEAENEIWESEKSSTRSLAALKELAGSPCPTCGSPLPEKL